MTAPSPSNVTTNSPLWQWIVARYETGKTKQACLDLQDQFAVDINIMLWLCWLANAKKIPTAQGFTDARALQVKWQDGKISGLRRARYALKADAHLHHQTAIKQAILAVELSFEKKYLEALGQITALSTDLNSGPTPRAADTPPPNHNAQSRTCAAQAIKTWIESDPRESQAVNSSARNKAVDKLLRCVFTP